MKEWSLEETPSSSEPKGFFPFAFLEGLEFPELGWLGAWMDTI